MQSLARRNVLEEHVNQAGRVVRAVAASGANFDTGETDRWYGWECEGCVWAAGVLNSSNLSYAQAPACGVGPLNSGTEAQARLWARDHAAVCHADKMPGRDAETMTLHEVKNHYDNGGTYCPCVFHQEMDRRARNGWRS